MTTPAPRLSIWLRLAGPLVFLAALGLYLGTLSPGPFPGDSTRLIIEQAELDAFPALNHPLYGLLARTLAALPGGDLALRLNAMSAVFGALAVWFIFHLTAAIPRNRSFEETMARFNEPAVRTVSGVVAAVIFATCIPFWMSATRAHVAPLNLALLCAAVWLLLRYQATRRFAWLGAGAFVYGIGATNFATMILLAPVYGVFALVFLFRAGQLNARHVTLLVLCGVAGLFPYAVGVWHYAHQSALEWRKFTGPWQVLVELLRAQYRLIAHGLPKLGWLTVAVVSVVPWLAVIGLRINPQGVHTRGAWFGSYLLNFFLLGLAGLVLTNALVSPWRMTGLRPLLVTPYALIAMWSGYVVGYWVVILIRRPRHDASGRVAPARLFSAVALAVVVLAGLVALAFQSRPLTDGRLARPVQQLARLMASHLEGRQMLISASPLDDLLLIEARAQGRTLRVVNHEYARSASYLNYVASLFSGNARLQGLAHVGLTPVLTEWLRTDPAARAQLAVLSAPDLWYAGGLEPVPDRSFFRAPLGPEEDMAALLAQHQRFWAEALPLLNAPQPAGSPATPWQQYIGRHLAKLANNLGVLLEERKQDDLAFEAYVKARQLFAHNVSALLNLHALCRRTQRPELALLEEELKKLPANVAMQHWALAYHHGYVRSPEAYAARGWAWALSGKPSQAIDDLQAAVQMGTNTAGLRLSMAGLFFEERPAESEKMLIEVLRERPNDRAALLALARAAMRKGDFDSARQYLGRLREAGANDAAVNIEESIVDVFSGRDAEAKRRLQDVIRKSPGNQRALTFLAMLAAEQNDQTLVDECLRQLRVGKATPPPVLLAVGHLALSRRDWVNARKYFGQYLRLRPTDKSALEQVLMLDRVMGDRDSAERHVEALLSLDAGNAMANYTLGHLQAGRGDLALAEASLRVCLERQRMPDALNELAWLLMLRDQFAEAERFARECVELLPTHSDAWDTLGVILLRQGKLPDAEQALQKALELRPDNPSYILHTAQLLEKKGQHEAALKLTDRLMANPAQLDKPAYDELRELVERLRDRV